MPTLKPFGADDRVKSLMVGPNTQVQIWKDANMQGKTDIFVAHKRTAPFSASVMYGHVGDACAPPMCGVCVHVCCVYMFSCNAASLLAGFGNAISSIAVSPTNVRPTAIAAVAGVPPPANTVRPHALVVVRCLVRSVFCCVASCCARVSV